MRRMEEERLCQLRNLAEQYHQILSDNRPKLVASSQRLTEPIQLCDITRDMEAVNKKVSFILYLSLLCQFIKQTYTMKFYHHCTFVYSLEYHSIFKILMLCSHHQHNVTKMFINTYGWPHRSYIVNCSCGRYGLILTKLPFPISQTIKFTLLPPVIGKAECRCCPL